jgi:MFS family permease
MRAVARTLPGGGPEASSPSVRRQLAEGFAYLFRTGWLFATLTFAILYVLVVMGPIEVLLPFAVRDRVGSGPAGLSLVLAAYGVGSAVGALVVSSRRLPRRYLTVTLLCWGFGALPLAAFGLATTLWVMVLASLAVGLTDAAAMVVWGTLLQRRVPPHLLGRVSSLDFFVSLALLPVSMALAGPVGERVGIPVAFVVAAVVPPVLAVVALLAWRLPRDEIAHPLDADRTVGEDLTDRAGEPRPRV